MITQEVPITLLSGSLVFFPPASVAEIPEGHDFYNSSFHSAEYVSSVINDGLMGAVDMGGQGSFWISPMQRSPQSDQLLSEQQYYFRMGLAVLNGRVCFRDLFELYCWKQELKDTPSFDLPDGFYDVTVATSIQNGFGIGAEQLILFIYESVPFLPSYQCYGIPTLFKK